MRGCHLSIESRTVSRIVGYLWWCITAAFPLMGSEDGFILVEQICFNIAKYPVLQSEIYTFAAMNKLTEAAAKEAFVEREFIFLYAMNNPLLGFSNIKDMASKHLESVMKDNRADKQEFSARLRKEPYTTTFEALEREITYQILMQRLIAMQKERRKISPKELEEERVKLNSTKNAHDSSEKDPEDIEFAFYRRMIWQEIQAKYNVELSQLSTNNECR